jgi:hypothetical protein
MLRKNQSCLVPFLLALILPAAGFGREFEVRLLKGTEKDGLWGTEEFQVSVNSQGALRHVAVHGKELIWQAAALYTAPVPPGKQEGVRTVQGEGVGERGLTVTPSSMDGRNEHGRRVFTFRHFVANKKVLDGKPLCQVDQRIAITPTGEIAVSYDCEWLHSLAWHNFSLLIFFPKEAIAGRDYLLLGDGRVLTGQLNPGGAIASSRLREPFNRLTIWSEVGPFHFVWDIPSICEFSPPQLTIQPRVVAYRGIMYKGMKDRMAYRILLPVSQQ